MPAAEPRVARLQAACAEARQRLDEARPGSLEHQIAVVAYQEALLALTLALLTLTRM